FELVHRVLLYVGSHLTVIWPTLCSVGRPAAQGFFCTTATSSFPSSALASRPCRLPEVVLPAMVAAPARSWVLPPRTPQCPADVCKGRDHDSRRAPSLRVSL